MTRPITKIQLTALRAQLEVPEDIIGIAASVRLDLWYGPDTANYEGTPATGFDSAIDLLSAWCTENVPAQLWLDTGCDIWLTSEPEGYTDDDDGYCEPDWDTLVTYDRKALLLALFTKEVAEYL